MKEKYDVVVGFLLTISFLRFDNAFLAGGGLTTSSSSEPESESDSGSTSSLRRFPELFKVLFFILVLQWILFHL